MANKIKLGRATKARLNSIAVILEANEIVYATDTFEIGVKTGSSLVWFPSAQELAKKVDKVSGKGLSTNDYTTTEKTKLSGIQAGAQKNPTFKTVGGQSIVGTGDIPVSGGGGDKTLFATYIDAYNYDVRTNAILGHEGRITVVLSTPADRAGFTFRGTRISGPNLNIEKTITYDSMFIYEIVTLGGYFFAIKASGQSEYSMYSTFRIDYTSADSDSDYINMVAWEG